MAWLEVALGRYRKGEAVVVTGDSGNWGHGIAADDVVTVVNPHWSDDGYLVEESTGYRWAVHKSDLRR